MGTGTNNTKGNLGGLWGTTKEEGQGAVEEGASQPNGSLRGQGDGHAQATQEGESTNHNPHREERRQRRHLTIRTFHVGPKAARRLRWKRGHQGKGHDSTRRG